MGVPSHDQPGLAHTYAIVARLVDEDICTVYGSADSIPDAPDFPYAVVWPVPARRPVTVMTGYNGTVFTRNMITVAGENEDDVVGVADLISGALAGWSPDIDNRVCGFVEHDDSAPFAPTLDLKIRSELGRSVYSAPLFFNLQSDPI